MIDARLVCLRHFPRFGAKVCLDTQFKPNVHIVPFSPTGSFLLIHLYKEPRVACPTCATTYSLQTGTFGPELKREGLAGFVSTWAKTATINNASQDVDAYIITRDSESGQVFCKER